jgi:hypothetical protein
MTSETTPLEGSLRSLETILETPVIAGELVDWCATAQRELAPLEQELHHATRGEHVSILKEIIEFDPEQGPRVERLKQADGELLSRIHKFKERLHKLCSASEIAGKDEARVAEFVEETIQTGLQLIIDIRRQELALSTWHSEAFKRDRGVVD